MGTAMLVAAIYADALAAASGADTHALPRPAPLIATLPVDASAAWPMRRCGDNYPGTDEATAAAAIDAGCGRLVVRDRSRTWRARAVPWRHEDSGGDSTGWRVARTVLPAMQGLVGPGGVGLGIGSELQFVRGARMTLHLAAARDTRIADTAFAPETTVLARCEQCWDESEAVGGGLLSVERRASSSTGSARRP